WAVAGAVLTSVGDAEGIEVRGDDDVLVRKLGAADDGDDVRAGLLADGRSRADRDSLLHRERLRDSLLRAGEDRVDFGALAGEERLRGDGSEGSAAAELRERFHRLSVAIECAHADGFAGGERASPGEAALGM